MALELTQADEIRPIIIETPEALQKMVKAYTSRKSPVFFDIETTGLDPRQDKLIMLQFMQTGRRPVIVDMRHASVWTDWLWAESLSPLFNGSVLVVGHNIKFDLNWMLTKFGIKAKRVYDTMVAEQVLQGLGKTDGIASGISFSLRATAERYGITLSKEERNWFIGLDQRDEWNQPFPDEQLRYGALDVSALLPIMEQQRATLKERRLLETAQLEMRTLPAIAEIEVKGVLIDVDGWREVIEEKRQEALSLEEQCLETFGPPILKARAKRYDERMEVFNEWERERDAALQECRDEFDRSGGGRYGMTGSLKWGEWKKQWMNQWREANPRPEKPKRDTSTPNLGSVKQLRDAFAILNIPSESTDSDHLSQLEDTYPAVALLLQWRKATKFVDAFGESLLKFVDPGTRRIHPEYVQIGASTGRMSCSRPNWQQIPSKGDGQRLRALVHPDNGFTLLTADFSNIELRILADMSRDENMLEMFKSGVDLHSYTARMMFGLDEGVDAKHEEAYPGVTYRAVAKTINFGLVYGMSATKLGRTLKITREEATDLMNKYFALYPGVERWLAEQRQSGIRQLASYTYSGRARYYSLPIEPPMPHTHETDLINEWREALSEWKATKHRIERQACNSPIQGTSADITKLAIALWYERTYDRPDLNAHIIAVVHDELVVECPEDKADEVAQIQAGAMYDAARYYLKVVHIPPTEVAQGDHWSKE